jgi:C1A family cysteine protease
VRPNGICSAKGITISDTSKNYYNLSDSDLISLLQNGPVAISIASQNWEYYSSGTLTCGARPTIDHAVLLIGYTSNTWIIKNQWGTDWGVNGFAEITRNTSRNCQIGSSAFVMSSEDIYIWAYTMLAVFLAVLY